MGSASEGSSVWGSVFLPVDDQRLLEGPVHAYAVSPERLWSWSYLLHILAYLLSAICLLTITKPDLSLDPIYNMYHSYHPCILLNYLPGTLFAQPLFVLQIYLQQATVLLTLTRHVVSGALAPTISSFICTVIFIIVSSQFVLVFTFGPTKTSIMAHSIPYMCYVFGILCFYISEGLQSYWRFGTEGLLYKEAGGKRWVLHIFNAYLFVTSAVIVYGLNFMLSTFMGNATEVWEPTDKIPLPEKEVEFSYLPMVAAVVLVGLYLCWGLLNPFIRFPLKIVVTSRSSVIKATGANGADAGDLAPQVGDFAILTESLPLKLSMYVALATAVLGEHVNGLAGLPLSCSWRDNLKTLPGAAITTVGWVFVALAICIHVLVVMYHVTTTSNSCILRVLVRLNGWLVIVGAFVAFGGTIPDAFEAYPGPCFFQLSLAAWMMMQIALIMPVWDRIHCRFSVPHVLCCIGVCVASITSLHKKNVAFDAAWMLLILLYAHNAALEFEVAIPKIEEFKNLATVYTPIWEVKKGSRTIVRM